MPVSAESFAWSRRLSPTLVVAVLLAAYVGISLARNEGDVSRMARLGLSQGDEGYDGQFNYWIAVDPANSGPHLDVPAYRFQRILYPLLARLFALGRPALIPWALLLINFAAQVAGTWAFGELLAALGVSRWYALAFGLWAGLVYAVRLALAEPLAFSLVAGALLASRRGREGWAAGLYALAVFAKETTLLFVAAHLVWLALRRDWRGAGRLAAATLAPFAVFQRLLLQWFGRLGLGSGGNFSTPFEVVPFMGLLRIAQDSPTVLIVFLVIFGPMVVFPTLWGLAASVRRWLHGDRSLAVLALAANAVILPFTPFSTFREPLGLMRLATGLVMAVIVFGAHTGSRRTLNYSMFWLFALVFLLNDV